MEKTAEKKYEMDMCHGPVLKKMLQFALPLMCSSLLQLLFNAADMIVVGRFAGDASLAAVGSNSALINLLTNVFLGLSVGANVVAANDYGAGDHEGLKKTVHTAMLLSVISGAALILIGLIGAEKILILMQTPEDILPLATVYLRIYFLGMIAIMAYNFGSAILRAVGDTRRPLYFMLGAGVLNVLLNLFFVIRLQMDVAGVGLATVISQCISAVLVVRCLMKAQGAIRLELRHLHIYKEKLTKIIRIGLPAGFSSIVFSISNVIIQTAVNTFGAVVVAGCSASANVEGFVYTAMYSFHHTTLSFTGQNMGAKQYNRVGRILFSGEICVAVTGLLLGTLAVTFGRPLLGIYSSSPEVVEAGMQRLTIIAGFYVLCGMMDVLAGSLRGMGKAFVPMIVNMIGVCGVRVMWVFTVFQTERFHTVRGLYFSYLVSWIVTLSVEAVCFVFTYGKVRKRALCD